VDTSYLVRKSDEAKYLCGRITGIDQQIKVWALVQGGGIRTMNLCRR